MKSIKSILKQNQNKSPLMKGITASLTVEYFQQLLNDEWGAKGQEQARALHLKNNILTIACLNSVIANEIQLKKGFFLDKINMKFGQNTVEQIKIII